MKYVKPLLVIIFFVIGCSSTSSTKTPAPSTPKQAAVQENIVKESESLQQLIAEVDTGEVFAKTEFEGVVKTSYVQLGIVDQSDESKVYQLYIGDKERQKSFPWDVQKVMPGYFFIELPAGQYRISSITIPVGTTTAEEEMDIAFEVREGKKLYIGTLKVFGTKDKIKLGGVPIIRPGFEYKVEVIDERFEAFEEILTRFSVSPKDLGLSLMKVNKATNMDLENKTSEKRLVE